MKFQLLHDYVHELRLVGVLRWWKPQCKRGKDAFGYALVTWNSTTSCVSPTSFSAAHLLATWQLPDLSSLCSLKVGSLARCACRCVCGYGSYQSLPRISFFFTKTFPEPIGYSSTSVCPRTPRLVFSPIFAVISSMSSPSNVALTGTSEDLPLKRKMSSLGWMRPWKNKTWWS